MTTDVAREEVGVREAVVEGVAVLEAEVADLVGEGLVALEDGGVAAAEEAGEAGAGSAAAEGGGEVLEVAERLLERKPEDLV
eukprot:CAMPEP_0198667584 /NCGR_PEP_ID=MMETSP1467-20131203/69102_1 /TAXON_ID=1462469 /ORGANISM="unid. sp., Strain CCMP2135" /LENGTH=81 /DNA_ID=CAMNT_0044404285 /DNA_START=76 /DNA_END=317 /DNA_ORIENTATION=+